MRLVTILSSIALLAIMSCNSSPRSTEADTSEALQVDKTLLTGDSLQVDPLVSTLLWEGSKLIGGAHSGQVPIISGTIMVTNNVIKGGDFVIGMKDLQPLDQDDESNAKLKAHLGSSDFFAVDSFPTATFDITSVVSGADTSQMGSADANSTVTGNLTIKGIAKSIRFPATVRLGADTADVKATFTIDRTKWGINYGAENSIKDKIINKDIEFLVHVKAQKQGI